ncbi:MAG: signal peptidase I [Clostridia bacterium]|nr:signal peptidase I [Clostridia bacterium]
MQYTNEAIKKRKARKYRIKKFLAIVAYCVLIPLLLYNTNLIIQVIINPNKTPSFLGIKTYVIVSGSMSPELNVGDIVVVKEVDTNTLQSKDIISYREGQTVITHRIASIEAKGNQKIFYTKGDNNNSIDNTEVIADNIEGKVVSSIPFLGKAVLLLQGKLTIIMVVLIFYAYFIRSEKVRNKKEARRLKRLEYEGRSIEDEQ